MKNKLIRTKPKEMTVTLKEHDTDFFNWTLLQANYLKKGEYSKLDIDNLIEEIESLGRSEKRTLESHLSNLFLHLLKIQYQPAKHTRSWDLSVKNAQYHAKRIYEENPSLKQHLNKIFDDAYYTARLKAMDETGIDDKVFPEKCPYKPKSILG